MAEHYVRAPKPFTAKLAGGNPAQAWDWWLLKFDIFLQATDVSYKPDKVKVGLLLNHIGHEGIDMFSNFNFLPERTDPKGGAALPAEDKNNYHTVVNEFAQFFHKKRSTTLA